MPRWFASDLLQRTPHGSMLREAWPSLFIGPAASRCALHVDAHGTTFWMPMLERRLLVTLTLTLTPGTHFWMLMLEGRKAWSIFPRAATPSLLPSYSHGHDASFGVEVFPEDDLPEGGAAEEDLLEGTVLRAAVDDRATELSAARGAQPRREARWRSLQRWSCVLQPGELLFVPAGCAHAVCNLEASCAISANFVSESNVRLAVDELSVTGLTNAAAAELASHLEREGAMEGARAARGASSHAAEADSGEEADARSWLGMARRRQDQEEGREDQDLTWAQFKNPRVLRL